MDRYKKIIILGIVSLILVGCEADSKDLNTIIVIGNNNNNTTTQNSYGYISGTCCITELGKYIDATVTVWADREIKYYGSMTITAQNGSFNFKLDSSAIYSVVATAYYNSKKYKGTIQGAKVGASLFIPMQKIY